LKGYNLNEDNMC